MLAGSFSAGAQIDSAGEVRLQEVVVRAFEQARRLKEVPAAVNTIGHGTLNRFSPASLVPAVNTIPGLRLEERSPGSYRFSIRGSALRSPFGVRNVKVYYNDLPFTDPGGHTYLNGLGFYNIGSVEVLKGPGSSLYGAGTGGVLQLESLTGEETPGAFAEYTTGSYRQQQVHASFTTRTENGVSRAGFQHQESNGYRNHSRLRRTVQSWNGLFRLANSRQLKTTFLYSDLFYQTPGALTKAEWEARPKSARPAAGSFTGAEGAGASIRQQTFLVGASYSQPIFAGITNKSTLYGAYAALQNPNIRAYDRNSEPHVGARTVFTFRKTTRWSDVRFIAGGESQQGFAVTSSFKNVGGRADSLRNYDHIRNRSFFAFAQVSLEVNRWLLEAGGSWNTLRLKAQRFSPRPEGELDRRFNNELAPRVALSKRWSSLTVYASAAKGFSPPATPELLPTGGRINTYLEAEQGTNYDLGLRATLLKDLYLDVNAFTFSLDGTIVQRRDAGGGDYFVNAGTTRQRGLETYLSYPLGQRFPPVSRGLFWVSHTWHHFRYREFRQLATDFSGRALPGVAPHTVSAGYDFALKNGFGAALTYYFSDRLPLNDANTEYAPASHLLGAKAGFEKRIGNIGRWKVTVGADNLLDQRYSLGNDINGFGGRYYNAAPGRNYYASLALQWERRKAAIEKNQP